MTCAFAKALPKIKNPRFAAPHLFCQCSNIRELTQDGALTWRPAIVTLPLPMLETIEKLLILQDRDRKMPGGLPVSLHFAVDPTLAD